MRFNRKFGSGLNKRSADARDKIWAEFMCDLCKETTDIDITRTTETFDYSRERRCPHCGLINSEDRAINLKTQLDKLLSDKSRIEISIDKLEREINELKTATKEENLEEKSST